MSDDLSPKRFCPRCAKHHADFIARIRSTTRAQITREILWRLSLAARAEIQKSEETLGAGNAAVATLHAHVANRLEQEIANISRMKSARTGIGEEMQAELDALLGEVPS